MERKNAQKPKKLAVQPAVPVGRLAGVYVVYHISMSGSHWSDLVLYQIYPRSFKDSRNDGVGDLAGITQKLDYLRGQDSSLGVSAIWISPFYPSPMADFGYDVSDYQNVDPLFGTLDDFKNLLHAAHQRELKVLIDFVPNHTSDEHEWFIQSRSSKDNPKRDWYIWRDPAKNGGAPNNWRSVFGGPAWQLDHTTGQYFLHSFLTKQPDLNWENPEVVDAMKNAMRFWLDMGVDGFRVDAISWLGKDTELRDDSVIQNVTPETAGTYEELQHDFSRNCPNIYKHIRQMTDTLREYPGRFMTAEFYPNPWNDVAAYRDFYEQVDTAVCAPFNFGGILMPWDASHARQFIDDFQSILHKGDLPVYCLGNHDQRRLASRVGARDARSAAVLHLSLPGMPCIYYGDEIAMIDQLVAPDKVQDPFEKLEPGNGRDPSRTPMPWRGGPGSGFSRHSPWLPLAKNPGHVNVTSELKDTNSMLNLYRRLLHYRSNNEVLRQGSYKSFNCPAGVLGFKRSTDQQATITLINFSSAPTDVKLDGINGSVAISSASPEQKPVNGSYQLAPHEGVIIEVSS